ncbi:DUF3592 domain-containing protein [Terrabacter carboxydivorans]|uniref:DUF3592 domain-containing protein n=1 Tax=Terrabacter carboxydivorans TaxID=619730 RepID=A0ABN3LUZ7_9MICO
MRTVLYAIWLLFVAGACYSLVRAVRGSRQHDRRTADWPRVQATVTGSRAGWTSGFGGTNRNQRFWPSYRFTDATGAEFTGTSQDSTVPEPVEGSALEVVYNPQDPSESYLAADRTRAALGCLVPFFVVFAIALFWFIGRFPLS